MAFTTVEVTGRYLTPTGEPATGSLTFTLTQPMSNSGVQVDPAPTITTLNEDGAFAVELYANDDTETVPTGVQYGVTEQIEEAQPEDYFVQVSHLTSPVDIANLRPGAPGWL
jgi:hypothetical protein